MIVIYEKSDLVDGAMDSAEFQPPTWASVNSDLRSAEAYADTVYIARQDGRFQMTKARNAPIDPYPVRIIVTRTIQDELTP